MMRFPFDRGDLSELDYILQLLLATLKKNGGEIRLKKSDFAEIEDNHSLIKFVDEKKSEIVLRYGPEHSELFFAKPQRKEKVWQNPDLHQPQSQPQAIPPTLIPRSNSTSSSQGKPSHFPYSPPPPSNLAKQRRIQEIPNPGNLEEASADEREEQEEKEQEQAEPFYKEPPLPSILLSPIEEIRQSQSVPQQPSHPTRRAILDDMNLFLKEQKMEATRNNKQKREEMIQRNRDGLLPFRVQRNR